MIKEFVDKENKIFTFEFDSNHICDFVHTFTEDNETHVLVNLLIKYYHDDKKREACKCLLDTHRHCEIIFDSIEKMIKKEKVIYTKSFTDLDDMFSNTLYSCFNSLYLNQRV